MKKKVRNKLPNRTREDILNHKKFLKERHPLFAAPLLTYKERKYSEKDVQKLFNYRSYLKKALRAYIKGDIQFRYKDQIYITPIYYPNQNTEIENDLVTENVESNE